MTTPYEDFVLWLKSKHGLKAETSYDAQVRDSLTTKYIQDALDTTLWMSQPRSISESYGLPPAPSQPALLCSPKGELARDNVNVPDNSGSTIPAQNKDNVPTQDSKDSRKEDSDKKDWASLIKPFAECFRQPCGKFNMDYSVLFFFQCIDQEGCRLRVRF